MWTSWTSDTLYYNLEGHDENAGESTSVQQSEVIVILPQLVDDANLDGYTLNSMSTKEEGVFKKSRLGRLDCYAH